MEDQIEDQELFKSIFESSAQGILVVDRHGIILRANQALEGIFGYDKGELVHAKLETLVPQETRKIHLDLQKKYSKNPHGRAMGKLDIWGLKKDGTQISLDISLNPSIVNSKKVVIAFVANNTERMQAQMSTITNEERMSEAQSIAHIGSWTWNLQTNERYWSDEFYRICGLTPGDKRLNAETVVNFIHAEDQDAALQKVSGAIENKTPYVYEKRIVTPEGALKYVLAKGKVTYDSKGEPLMMKGTMQDITELKMISLDLEREKEILKKYLDTAASIFLVINKNHTIELINKKGCELLNYPQNELIGKNWFQNFIPKTERKEMGIFFENLLNGLVEPPEPFENWILTKGNIKKLIRWRNAILKDTNGDAIGLISSGVDITEQVVLEQELRVSEEKNRAILEALPDIIAIHDAKGTFLDIQSAIDFQFPYPIHEIKGKKVSDFIADTNECENILKAYAQVIRTKKMEIIEIAVNVLNRTFDIEARIVPFEKDKVLVVLRDITKSREIQNVLDTRNRALQVAGNGIVIVDARHPELPIIYCNKAFTEMTGYSHEEVIGVNCQFLQNDDRDQEAIVKMSNAIQNGEACRVILRNYRKEGTLFWNELSITPLYNENNELTHFIGVQNDVTEIIENRKELERYTDKLEETIEGRTRELKATVEKLVETNLDLNDQIVSTKVAEEKARTSQEMFKAIAQNFPKGVIIVFNSDFELVYVEGEELDRIDLKKSNLEGALIDDITIFSNIQKSKLKEDIQNTLAGTAISTEVDFQEQKYTVNSTPLYGDQEKVVWALFVYNNVTEQKNIQQNLEAALKIEQDLNELKSRFISMASHEFRTPLSAILSSAILIGKQNEPGHEERRMKHVFRIRNNVKNLVVILNDFLSLSKLEEGKVNTIPQHFELIEFSKLVVEEMEATKKEGQQILLLTEETSIVVYLDPKLLSHILINLLSNATKYSKEDQNIHLEISITGTHVILTVIDEGIGIPQEEQEKLFGRFFRAANATNIQGTGLGLHIVKQYVELMGGDVSCNSEIRKGTTFTVKLPLKMQ
tara:strand:- start:58236 stop:61358 length:3123 start_codon:yes stop_codon:yes gene_type:complete